jgi:hypothetical protein
MEAAECGTAAEGGRGQKESEGRGKGSSRCGVLDLIQINFPKLFQTILCEYCEIYCPTEERKKAKQSYQESLQNVATVRQQASVSSFHISSEL